jgi:hypothetical protein
MKQELMPQDRELECLNQELYSELSIEELEKRLETKPWICGAYVDCPALACGGTNNPPAVVIE